MHTQTNFNILSDLHMILKHALVLMVTVTLIFISLQVYVQTITENPGYSKHTHTSRTILNLNGFDPVTLKLLFT